MAQIFVTCPECGLRVELAHSDSEFDDPEGECKHHVNPAKCRSIRGPLIAASRMLDLLEWEAIVADEALQLSASIPADQDAA